MIRQDYLEKIRKENGWIFDKDFKANICITDDLDSLLSAYLLIQYRPNMQVTHFYDYKKGVYKISDDVDETLPLIGLDLSCTTPGFYSVSNHISKFNNEQINSIHSINLNEIDGATLQNYHSKYNLSTFLLVSSLMDHKFEEYKSQCFALCIDSSYLGYYANPSYQDKYINKKYLEVLGYPDMLNALSKNSKETFIAAKTKYNLTEKIYIDNNEMYINEVNLNKLCEVLGIEVTDRMKEIFFKKWVMIEEHRSYFMNTLNKVNISKLSKFNSFAITSKNYYCYSCKC